MMKYKADQKEFTKGLTALYRPGYMKQDLFQALREGKILFSLSDLPLLRVPGDFETKL